MSTIPQTQALDTVKPQTMVRIEQHVAHLLPQEDIRSRFAAVMMQQIRVSPALQKCTPESVIAAVVRMAQLQLDPALPNECWLVPFKTEATFIIGYGGLRKLALRSPEVRDILVAAVHEHDTYASPESPIALPTHRRAGSFKPRGPVIGYYAAALLAAGHWRVIEMSRAEVKGHRDRYSRSAQSTFWAEGKPDEEGLSNFDKMALKTVLRQLCSPRNLTLSAEVKTALGQEESLYDPHYRQLEEPQRPPVQSGNGHQAANDLFGGDQGLLGVGHQRTSKDDQPEEDEGDGLTENDRKDAFIISINTTLKAKGYTHDTLYAWWNGVCANHQVDEPEFLPMHLLKHVATLASHANKIAPSKTVEAEDSESSNARAEVTVPGDDIPEKLHGGQLYLDQIDAAWRAGGLNEAQIISYWVKTCKRFHVERREQLRGSLLPVLLNEVREWMQRQEKVKPEPEPGPEELGDIDLGPGISPVNTMGSAWRLDLPLACKGVQDKETLDAVWEATLDPNTPDAVGEALLERVRVVAADMAVGTEA